MDELYACIEGFGLVVALVKAVDAHVASMFEAMACARICAVEQHQMCAQEPYYTPERWLLFRNL